MDGIRTQRGMSFFGFVFVLVLIGFFSLLALRLVPLYLDNYRIQKTLDSLQQEAGITQKPPEEIRRLIERRLYINDVTSVSAKDFKIEQKGGRTVVQTEYEVTRPFLGNISLLVRFHNSEEIVAH